ncbi:MAG: universal stress protein [Bradyrhizobium sp.]
MKWDHHNPRGPRSCPSYAVSSRHYLVDPIRPTRGHIAFSPHGGLYAMPSLCGSAADILTENKEAARSTIERFEAAVKGSLLSVEHRLVEAPASFSEMARRYDLSVVMQSNNENGVNNDILIEATLFESGRPVIVVPYIQKEGMNLDRIVCCWDGSRAAARAINDALPLLQKARAVELLIVTNEKTGNGREIRGVEIGSHLARHGIKVEVEILPAADIDVANVILSRVAECSASMIVMGGYGHSRFREFILGGATRGVLTTMTVPVFISH